MPGKEKVTVNNAVRLMRVKSFAINRKEIADLINIKNVRKLDKLFKKQTRRTVQEYKKICRLEFAEELCKERNYSFSQISRLVGYSTRKGLYDLFNRYNQKIPMKRL
jgi:transcriptional regulator GlxA family with amidase domain